MVSQEQKTWILGFTTGVLVLVQILALAPTASTASTRYAHVPGQRKNWIPQLPVATGLSNAETAHNYTKYAYESDLEFVNYVMNIKCPVSKSFFSTIARSRHLTLPFLALALPYLHHTVIKNKP